MPKHSENRGSVNSPLLILFSAIYIDQLNRDFYAIEGILEGILEALTFDLKRLHTQGDKKT